MNPQLRLKMEKEINWWALGFWVTLLIGFLFLLVKILPN